MWLKILTLRVGNRAYRTDDFQAGPRTGFDGETQRSAANGDRQQFATVPPQSATEDFLCDTGRHDTTDDRAEMQRPEAVRRIVEKVSAEFLSGNASVPGSADPRLLPQPRP